MHITRSTHAKQKPTIPLPLITTADCSSVSGLPHSLLDHADDQQELICSEPDLQVLTSIAIINTLCPACRGDLDRLDEHTVDDAQPMRDRVPIPSHLHLAQQEP